MNILILEVNKINFFTFEATIKEIYEINENFA